MSDCTSPRIVLVGEVRTADHALEGLLRAKVPPCALVTTDRDRVLSTTPMSPDYFAGLASRGAELRIPVLVVDDLAAAADQLRAFRPDYLFIMGWPYMVRRPVLDLAPCVGMHPTRLPARRGGAPLNWSILDGATSSAVSLLRLREGVDSGELLAQRDFAIGPDDYVGDVAERVYALTGALVEESARALAAGTATWTPQDDALATYTRRRTPEDGRILWRESAPRIRNLVRAVSYPFPGAFTMLAEQRWTIWRADLPTGYRAPLRAAPGTILEVDGDGVIIGTRDNALRITEATIGEWRSTDGDGHVLRGEALRAMAAPHRGRIFDCTPTD